MGKKIPAIHALGYGVVCKCSNCKQTLTIQNCQTPNERGLYSYHLIMDEDDPSGYEWRAFCDVCWFKDQEPHMDVKYNKYPAAEWDVGNSDTKVLLR